MKNNKQLWCLSITRDTILDIKNKIYLWFLNKFVAKEDELYSLVEPTNEWMNLHNKKFWIQPCNEEEII